jgi:hypothetical protein
MEDRWTYLSLAGLILIAILILAVGYVHVDEPLKAFNQLTSGLALP